MNELTKGTKIYYAQIMPSIPQFELLDLHIRTVGDTWFTALEQRTKHAFLFNNKDIGKTLFYRREEALEVVSKAELECKKKPANELDYEEY